jgi:hypothetical protein
VAIRAETVTFVDTGSVVSISDFYEAIDPDGRIKASAVLWHTGESHE